MSLSTRARILNFLLPGAGLCLLGKWKQGVINGLVAGLMLVAAGAMGGVWAEEIHYVWLVLASGSAGWAHAVAVNMTGDTGVTKPDMGFHEKPIQPAP